MTAVIINYLIADLYIAIQRPYDDFDKHLYGLYTSPCIVYCIYT